MKRTKEQKKKKLSIKKITISSLEKRELISLKGGNLPDTLECPS